MATELFPWRPRFDPVGDFMPRVLVAQFGDGYRQSAGDGINALVQTWPLEFVDDKATILEIKAFLDLHAGYRAFNWVTPLGDTNLYEAGKYSVNPKGGDVFSLTVTFTQAFRP